MRLIDLTGQRFGRWTVLERAENDKNSRNTRWRVRCDCGTNRVHQASNLRSGSTTSCGCSIHERVITKGSSFGQLVAIERVGRTNPSRWKFRCDCSKEIVAFVSNVTTGKTRSCGCSIRRPEYQAALRKRSTRHGHTAYGRVSGEYHSWQAMITRCTNKNAVNYYLYGGRADHPVTVCEEWLGSFERFLQDLGPRPEGTTLDRKNGLLGYFPGNVRWSTPKEQANNRRPSQRHAARNERGRFAKRAA